MIEFFVAPALAIGLLVSIFDFKHKKIPNYAVVALIVLGLVFQFFSEPPLAGFAYTIAYGFFTVFLLWFVGMWPAGDAKFFWAFLFWFPAKFYSDPSLLLDFLFNAFVPIFFFMFFFIIYKSKFALLKEAAKYSLDPYKISMISLMLIGFVWFFSRAIAFFGVPQNYFVYLLILFAAFELLRKFFTFKTELVFLGFTILRLIFDFKNVYSLGFVQNFALMIAIFVFFRFFVLYLAFRAFAEPIAIKNLKSGMIPAEGISKKSGKYGKIKILEMSMIGFMAKKKEKFIHNTAKLSAEDIEKIKKLKKEKKLPFGVLSVNQTQAFALFIFLGYIITLVSGGRFLALLM